MSAARAGLVLALFTAGACTAPTAGRDRSAIVGDIEALDAPWVVALGLTVTACGELPTVSCSGVVLGPRVVLTAAHCLSDRPDARYEVFAGADVSEDGERRQVVDFLRHPDWDPETSRADLALLVLARSLPGPFASLGTEVPDDSWVGTPLTLAGFGAAAGGSEPSGVRQAADGLVASIDADFIVLGAMGAVSCKGDSGGPALRTSDGALEVVGVASFGDRGCRESSSYVRLDGFVDSFITPFLETPLAPEATSGPIAEPMVCETPCGTHADCPAGLRCVDDLSSETPMPLCTRDGLEPGILGEPCVPGDSCHCIATDAGCRCLEPCVDAPNGGGCSTIARRHTSVTPMALTLAMCLGLSRRRRRR